MSGSSAADWVIDEQTAEESAWLLELVGCKKDRGDLSAKDCLKRTPNEKIALSIEKMRVGERYLNIAVFGPRIDDDLFPTAIGHLIWGAPPKPTLLGLVEEESAFFTVFPPPSIGRLLAISPEKQATFGPDDFEQFLVNAVAINKNSVKKVRREILDFHTKADNASQVCIADSAFYVKRYTEMCSDVLFNIPILSELVAKEVNDWPMFAYFNTYLSGREMAKPPHNVVTHLYDHNFIFRGGNQLKAMNFTPEDDAVSRFLITALVSFVKTGYS
ncbi:CBN-GES-1 protein [Aphelenchoides avenae]|nr:CBN-GES-1 protein [Aphelenchus avenae]